MNHRASSLAWTLEDAEILLRGGSTQFATVLRSISLLSDMTDASLMWSMCGAASALSSSTWERRHVLAHWFGDPFCGLLK